MIYTRHVDTNYSYIHWLEQHHPEALPPDRYSLSVSDLFSSVSPLTPLTNTPTTTSLRSQDQLTKAISNEKNGTSGKADKNAATTVTSPHLDQRKKCYLDLEPQVQLETAKCTAVMNHLCLSIL